MLEYCFFEPWEQTSNFWNLQINSHILIHENAFDNTVCEMAAFLSRPQWVDIKDTIPLKKVAVCCSNAKDAFNAVLSTALCFMLQFVYM